MKLLKETQRREAAIKRRKRRTARRFPNEVWLPEEIRGVKTELSYRAMSVLIKQKQAEQTEETSE